MFLPSLGYTNPTPLSDENDKVMTILILLDFACSFILTEKEKLANPLLRKQVIISNTQMQFNKDLA